MCVCLCGIRVSLGYQHSEHGGQQGGGERARLKKERERAKMWGSKKEKKASCGTKSQDGCQDARLSENGLTVTGWGVKCVCGRGGAPITTGKGGRGGGTCIMLYDVENFFSFHLFLPVSRTRTRK